MSEELRQRLDPWRSVTAYVLQDDLHNRLEPRIVDVAYTAFMSAHKPNPDDGGKTDWFTDTKPIVDHMIGKIKESIEEEFSGLVTRSEMEEALAKAVAEEREAMAHETSRLLGEWIRRGKLTEKLPDAPYVVADYRARSEQKE